MPLSNKNVSFQIMKTLASNKNIFDVFNQEEEQEQEQEIYGKKNASSLPPIHEIIWGKGFISFNGVSWADECDA